MISDDDINKLMETCTLIAKDISKAIGKNVVVNKPEISKKILKMCLQNKEKYGEPFCPCKPAQRFEKIKNKDGFEVFRSSCKCVDCESELLKKGSCCCNLYIIEK